MVTTEAVALRFIPKLTITVGDFLACTVCGEIVGTTPRVVVYCDFINNSMIISVV